MRRYLPIILLLGASCGALACQQYSTGLQQSRTQGNEPAALAALRSISSAQRIYGVSNNGHYGTFAQLVQAGSLDSRFDSSPKVSGYVLTMKVTTAAGGAEDSYSVNADPDGPGLTGRHFFMDQSGLIHANNSQAATAADPPLEP